MPATTAGVSWFWWLVIGAVAVAALWWLFAAPGRATVAGLGGRRDRAAREAAGRENERGRGENVSAAAQPAWTEQQGDGRAGVRTPTADAERERTGDGGEYRK